MVFQRPQQPNRNQATQRQQNQPHQNQPQQRNRGEEIPSPWLGHPLNSDPQPDSSAGFSEYLRWMRAADHPDKDIAKLRILQMIEENTDYSDRLRQLNKRTKLIAGENNCFPVTCPWRIRIGGHRGPESILLPAFDALGIPYIPSSTLRGVTRNQAILDFIQQGQSRQQAEAEVIKYFGGLDAIESERTSKVIFLDAYPIPANKNGGLSVDITNNIWQWDDNNQLDYNPNPQTFLSIQKTDFLIGIRPIPNCNDDNLQRIRNWLITGLQNGIGSQVNTGYGRLIEPKKIKLDYFVKVQFTITGQLIHSTQKFKNLDKPYQTDNRGVLKRDENGNLKPDTSPVNEVRSTAFKSMLRYWFRAFASGVLPIGNTETLKNYLKEFHKNGNLKPPAEVRALEAILFGSITPHTRGWVKFKITKSEITPSERESDGYYTCGEQTGNLILGYSSEAPPDRQKAIQELFTNLTWIMFHLGGVGQGARRPCYSRQQHDNPNRNNSNPPHWRGSTLIPESKEQFWKLPKTVQELQELFRERLKGFYTALKELTDYQINYQQLRSVSQVRDNQWSEVVDNNCHIIVCSGNAQQEKPYALSVLHQRQFKQ